jgi:hypothetical protein
MTNKYVPVPPISGTDPANYTFGELQDLAQALSSADEFSELQVLHVAPDKPRDGMIVFADGTNWNPGGGSGAYAYHDGAWVDLEGGGGSGANLTWTAATRTVASDTGTDAVITLVTSTDAGLAPLSGGGTTNFLRADATWAAPAAAAHAVSHKLAGGDSIRLDEFALPTASVSFNDQQAVSFRIENRTSDPGSPATGALWLRTDL